MDILYLLIPLAIVVLIIAIAAFIWAVKSGQFEDMEGPAHRILMDEDDPLIPTKASSEAATSQAKEADSQAEAAEKPVDD